MATFLVAGDDIDPTRRLPAILRTQGHVVIDESERSERATGYYRAAVLGVRFGISNGTRQIEIVQQLAAASEALLARMRQQSSITFVIERPRFKPWRWRNFLKSVSELCEYISIQATNRHGIACAVNALITSPLPAFRTTTISLAHAISGGPLTSSGMVINEDDLRQSSITSLVNDVIL